MEGGEIERCGEGLDEGRDLSEACEVEGVGVDFDDGKKLVKHDGCLGVDEGECFLDGLIHVTTRGEGEEEGGDGDNEGVGGE